VLAVTIGGDDDELVVDGAAVVNRVNIALIVALGMVIQLNLNSRAVSGSTVRKW
jgi:hypothetical protein